MKSKATLTQGLRFLLQLASLRFGRLSAFAVIGAIGAVVNLAIMAGLVELGMNYVIASIIAAVLTIIGNFFLQEHFVFRDLRHEGRGPVLRFIQSFTFNGTEAALRLPMLAFLVEVLLIPSILAQAICLVLAFVIRFVFMSRVVYRPRRTSPIGPLVADPPTSMLRRTHRRSREWTITRVSGRVSTEHSACARPSGLEHLRHVAGPDDRAPRGAGAPSSRRVAPRSRRPR